MADEQVQANQGTAVPGEAAASQANPVEFDIARDQAIKDRARKLGWKPKAEYDGDPAEWRPAKEFLERQSFFDKIKAVKDDLYQSRRENKQLQKDLAIIKEYVQNMSKIERERAIAELQHQKAAAVQEANVDEVRRIDAQIDTIRDTKVEPKGADKDVPQGPPPEFFEWTGRNKWYDEDPELRAEADDFGMGIMRRNPSLPVTEVLRQVEVKIKKMYPEKFPTQTRRPAASAVEAGGVQNSGAARSKGKLTVSDLDETQRKAMDAFVKRGVLTQEQYLESLSKSMGMR